MATFDLPAGFDKGKMWGQPGYEAAEAFRRGLEIAAHVLDLAVQLGIEREH